MPTGLSARVADGNGDTDSAGKLDGGDFVVDRVEFGLPVDGRPHAH